MSLLNVQCEDKPRLFAHEGQLSLGISSESRREGGGVGRLGYGGRVVFFVVKALKRSVQISLRRGERTMKGMVHACKWKKTLNGKRR